MENQAFMRPNNPFLIAGYYSPEYFCDREKETKTIIDALYNGRDITLIAPRRMGKTGIIKHVFYKLKENNADIATFYLDVYSTQNLSDFVKALAGAIIGQLDSTSQKTIERIKHFFKSCRPMFTFDEFSGTPKVYIDIIPSQETTTLKEIFDYLSSSEKRCYIAIDEFQQIAEYPEKGIEALLRSYIQFLPNVNFIFAGSKQHVMQQMFLSAKKPFYQSTQIMSIEKIDQEKYFNFASSFFDAKNIELPNNIFTSIYNKFDGHTWYIQSLLNRLYSYSKPINNELEQQAAKEIIDESSYLYENLLNAYSTVSIKLLKAIATEGVVKEINAGEFIQKYSLKAASSINTALKRLIENELVYKTPQGYIIYDRFMNEWLKTQIY